MMPINFIRIFHQDISVLSLQFSLVYQGDFIVIFILTSGGFHCDFHCYIQGISLQFSLEYLGSFIVIFISTPRGFHCNFH